MYIPYNTEDIDNASKERDLAQGPKCNREFLIGEYKNRKQRKLWDDLDAQNGFFKNNEQ